MFLSLGGNILPNASGDYEGAANRYDGIIGNNMDEEEARLLSVKDLSAVQFAEVVSARAQNPLGGSNTLTVGFGMLCQLGWIGIIIFACWFTEQGAIVAWWCKVRQSLCVLDIYADFCLGLGLDDRMVWLCSTLRLVRKQRSGTVHEAMDNACVKCSRCY